METQDPKDRDIGPTPPDTCRDVDPTGFAADRYYIDGQWVRPGSDADHRALINPATETAIVSIPLAGADDVDRAVGAARRAFDAGGWRDAPVEKRSHVLQLVAEGLAKRQEELAQSISLEVGSPIDFAREHQVGRALQHVSATIDALHGMAVEMPFDGGRAGGSPTRDFLRYEPRGVAALITPWNWPLNQMVLKLIGGLAAGCSIVLKPSELAPLTGLVFADIVGTALADGEVPDGVFNLINGDGPGAGAALCSHAGVDLISFTGSTATGRTIARLAAENVTPVQLELGGKSANILFADCDVDLAVRQGVAHCFRNSGQACNAASRMLVHTAIYDDVVEIAGRIANETRVASPRENGRHLGPLISVQQFDRVQRYIQLGIDQGARLIAGGPGRPTGLSTGYYVRPTVFADVTPEMAIFQDEIFGPVLSLSRFNDEDEAIMLANASAYGLAGYIQTQDNAMALRVARRLDVGMVQINGTSRAPGTPFGGRKASGYGREAGLAGIRAFQDLKSLSGIRLVD
ncbi:MAG: aldehyde dehydrogenase family protein [Pseudomonadota bacterium]